MSNAGCAGTEKIFDSCLVDKWHCPWWKFLKMRGKHMGWDMHIHYLFHCCENLPKITKEGIVYFGTQLEGIFNYTLEGMVDRAGGGWAYHIYSQET